MNRLKNFFAALAPWGKNNGMDKRRFNPNSESNHPSIQPISFTAVPHETYPLTEADAEMLTEESTGHPVKPENLAAGIAAMEQRIAQLSTEKEKFLARLDEVLDEHTSASLLAHLATVNTDLATARRRLADYQAQLGAGN